MTGSVDPAVHYAVVRNGLWSPACSDQQGWTVPLAFERDQVLCKRCRATATNANSRNTGDEVVR